MGGVKGEQEDKGEGTGKERGGHGNGGRVVVAVAVAGKGGGGGRSCTHSAVYCSLLLLLLASGLCHLCFVGHAAAAAWKVHLLIPLAVPCRAVAFCAVLRPYGPGPWSWKRRRLGPH